MIRRSSNEKTAFTETTAAYIRELQATLNNRRTEMDGAWDVLDLDWKKRQRRMVAIGITKPVSLDGGVVHLNVGGEHLNISRAILESIHAQNSEQRWSLANLFGGDWDSRVPRDKSGRIVLDESPVIVKHIVHKQLKASMTNPASGVSRDLPTSLPFHQRPYLQHVSSVLELHNPPSGIQILGGSTVLKETSKGWKQSKVEIERIANNWGMLRRSRRVLIFFEHLLSVAIVSRCARFWPEQHRELPFLAIVQDISTLYVCVLLSHLFWTSALWTCQPGSQGISPPSFRGTCLNFSLGKGSAIPFPR